MFAPDKKKSSVREDLSCSASCCRLGLWHKLWRQEGENVSSVAPRRGPRTEVTKLHDKVVVIDVLRD
jgi:hypothetical protein